MHSRARTTPTQLEGLEVRASGERFTDLIANRLGALRAESM